MAGKLVVVTGVTGNQGGSVADAFLDAGYKVRGLTRDPSKPSGKKWTDKGVELVAGDLANPDQLKSAFKGANIIFANTDYWSAFAIPECHQKAAQSGRMVTEHVQELETEWGQNAIDAAATTVDTLEYFILSTLSHAKVLSDGKYTHTHHFDAKGDQVKYLFDTPALAELKKKTSLIQMPFFLNNWKIPGSEFLIPKKQSDGTYVLKVNISPERKIPMGDPTKLAGPFAVGLTKVEPGKNLVCSAGMLTFVEWCDKCSEYAGVPVKFEECGRDVLEDAMPGGIGQELADMFAYYNDFGYDGSDPTAIYPDQLGVDVKYESADEYFKNEDWSKLVNQSF